MPTALRSGSFRLFFDSGDGVELPHVHVERDDCEAKFWLDPVRRERSGGFRPKDSNRIRELVVEHHAALMESWNEFFGGRNA